MKQWYSIAMPSLVYSNFAYTIVLPPISLDGLRMESVTIGKIFNLVLGNE